MKYLKLSTLLSFDNELKCGLEVNHVLSKKQVIYGFVPVYKKDEFITFDDDLLPMDDFHVCYNVLTTKRFDDCNNKYKTVTKPIFDVVKVCEKSEELILNEIYVPELTNTQPDTYSKMRSYRNTHFSKKFSRPGIIEQSSSDPKKYLYHTTEGEYLFQCNNGVIRGVGNGFMVICRETNPISGEMYFSMFRPDELFCEGE